MVMITADLFALRSGFIVIFTGYPGKVLGPRNRVPQFLRIGTPGPFNRVGQEINGIVTKGSKSVGQFIVFLFIFLDELLHRR